MSLRTVGIRLTADVSAYMTNMRRAGAATKDFAGQLDKAAKGGHLDAVADRAGVAGIALAGMAGYAVKAAADFDKSMSAVKAATNDSTKSVAENAKNMRDLRAAALQAGKDTSFSATEAAQGITELAKAGVATADILKGGLKGALDLAAAGQLSVGEASETAASAMTQFKLSGRDVPHIADLLAAGAGKAQGSVHDMSAALNQSGLISHQFGLSIEDTTGTLAAFANAGLIGSDAGTSFKTMLLALANPTSKTKEAMDDLGISAYDAQGKFVGITALAEQLKTKLGGLTQAQRDQTLAQIFGSDAIRAANVLYQQGGKGIQDWIGKVNDAGYASKTAATMTDNLAGDIDRLKGSLETLAIESGSGANDGIRVLVKSLDALVGQFSDLPPVVGSGLTILAAVGGASALALAAFIKLRSGLATAVAELSAMGPAGEKAAAGLQKTAAAAGKAALGFIALEAATAALKELGPEAANVDKLANSLTKLAETGKVTGEMADKFGHDLHGINNDAAVATSGVAKWLDKIAGGVPILGDTARAAVALGARLAGKDDYQTAVKNFENLDAALTDYMNTTGDARKASELWNEVLSKSGLDTQQLADLMPNAWKKITELNTAQNEAGRSGHAMAAGTKAAANGAGDVASATPAATTETKKYTTAADAAAAAARGERDALSQLSTFMKAQIDPVFGFIEAQKALSKAQRDAKQAQTDLDKAIDDHGPKSKQAKAATEKLDSATRNLASAAVDLQGKTGDLGQAFNGKLSPSLLATFKAAGLTDTQIKILTGQFKNAKTAADAYDGRYEALASAPGAKQAKTDLDKAYTAANGFAGPYRADVSVRGDVEAGRRLDRLRELQESLKAGKNISIASAMAKKGFGYAEGGWTGPGSKYAVAGVVHADEYVVNKASRGSLEDAKPGGLDFMNRTGRWPGFAEGGVVGWPFRTTAAMTRIPSEKEVRAVVVPALPAGGQTSDWIVRVVRAAFPGLRVLSKDRPGAVTLTGNRSYHSMGRAVDFEYSKALAQWVNKNYMGPTRELITPWQSLNIQNGRRHAYSPLVYNQHNFAGGNPHDHWAMKAGGTIREPVVGVGASGATYSFGENYQPERVIPNWQGGGGGRGAAVVNVGDIVVHAPVGSHPREIGAAVAGALGSFLDGGGELRVRGQKLL